jgi:hypothetical protein
MVAGVLLGHSKVYMHALWKDICVARLLFRLALADTMDMGDMNHGTAGAAVCKSELHRTAMAY